MSMSCHFTQEADKAVGGAEPRALVELGFLWKSPGTKKCFLISLLFTTMGNAQGKQRRAIDSSGHQVGTKVWVVWGEDKLFFHRTIFHYVFYVHDKKANHRAPSELYHTLKCFLTFIYWEPGMNNNTLYMVLHARHSSKWFLLSNSSQWHRS